MREARSRSWLRGLRLVGLALALAGSGMGLSSCNAPGPGSGAHSAAPSPAVDLRLNAEAFRLTAAVNFPKALQIYGAPQANARFVALAGDMWPQGGGAQGWSLFFSTALVNVARADQSTAVVAFYHPWSDVILITGWSKGQGGKYQIVSADVVLGSVVRGARPPYPTAREWQTQAVYGPEAVGRINAATTRAFEAAYAPNGPGLTAQLSPEALAAMPVGAAIPLAEFRLEVAPLYTGTAPEDASLWAQARMAAITGRSAFTGDAAATVAVLAKLDPRVRASLAPVARMVSGQSHLVIAASRLDPDIYLAVRGVDDGGQARLRDLTLLSFQAFYDASAKGTAP